MNAQLSNYLNIHQYNKICKYWVIINKLNYKLSNFNKSKYTYCSEYSDEETILKYIENNNRIDNEYKEIKEKLDYYEKEYSNYINKIGFELNDKEQDEHLFNLLNNGILLND